MVWNRLSVYCMESGVVNLFLEIRLEQGFKITELQSCTG